jgi:hypothetical protein
MRQPHGGEQRADADLGCHVGTRGPQRSLEPIAPLANVARAPQPIEVGAQLHRTGRGLHQEDLERRAQVVEVAVEPVELLARGAGAEDAALLARRRGAHRRHPQVRGNRLAALGRPLAQVAAHRHEHREARLGRRARRSMQQAAIHEGGERGERIELERREHAAIPALGRLDGRHVEAVGEGRQPAQQRLLVGLQQVVAPIEGAAQRPLARGEVARADGVQPDRRVPARQHGRRGQHRHAGGRELDRQRQAIQAPADLGHRRDDVGRELEARVARPGADDEQRDGRAGLRLAAVRRGRAQRCQRQRPLGREPEHVPARDQGRDPRAGVEQGPEVGRGGLDVLEVVEHEQGPSLAQRRRGRLERRCATRRPGAGGRRDRLGHQARVLERGEVDAHDAVGPIRPHDVRGRERQARLAHAGRAADRDQASLGVAQHGGETHELSLAADELASGHAPMVARARTASKPAAGVSEPVASGPDGSARRTQRRRARGPRRPQRRSRPNPSRSRCPARR